MQLSIATTKPHTVLCTACQIDLEASLLILSNFSFHTVLQAASVCRPPKNTTFYFTVLLMMQHILHKLYLLETQTTGG